jgi:hypothetical protein
VRLGADDVQRAFDDAPHGIDLHHLKVLGFVGELAFDLPNEIIDQQVRAAGE